MSAVTRALTSRRGTLNTFEAMDKEEFERVLVAALNKAINTQEVPVKEKHMRTLILASYKEKGAGSFWINVIRLQIESHPLLSWKFCHVLHKMLRDGHKNVISDSLKYKTKINDLGRLWSHIKDGYGPLILQYCKLILTKLEFHHRNVRVPGSLQLSDEELESLGERDVNNWFELSVEMLDYMEDVLQLQRLVFNSIDMSRASSMTSSGQCKLAPLIVCILDSSMLYDYLVKMLFKLYSSLPPDVLTGHRDRFNTLFKGLKQFYYSSTNLQYFKYLVSIPTLPEGPPNFVIASEFENYVTPEVHIHENAFEHGAGFETPPDTRSVASMPLLDLNSDASKSPKPNDEKLMAELGERDRQINVLRHELDDAKATLHQSQIQTTQTTQRLQKQIVDLQKELLLEKELIEQLTEENERYQKEAEQLQNEKNQTTVSKLEESEKKTQCIEDKFKKMKEIYGNLRNEHVETLKKLSNLQKDFECTKRSAEEFAAEKNIAKASYEDLENEHQYLKQQFNLLKSEKAKLFDDLKSVQGVLDDTKSELETCRNAFSLEKETFATKLDEKLNKLNELNTIITSHDKFSAELFDAVCNACKTNFTTTLDQFDNPAHLGVTCSPEFLLSLIPSCIEAVELVLQALKKCVTSEHIFNTDYIDLSGSVIHSTHLCCETLLNGKAVSNTASTTFSENIEALCRSMGHEFQTFCDSLHNKDNLPEAAAVLNKQKSNFDQLATLLQNLLGKISDVSSEELSDLLEKEMKLMDQMVNEAATRIQEIMTKTKKEFTGVKLEVNSKILDACTTLMETIIELIKRSRDLQNEIVATSGSGLPARDFYKRHHQWAEGLVSAAKSVGAGARFLVEAADRAISVSSGGGQPRLEELLVASQQIAAGTAQLAVASRVKADRGSQRLVALSQASRQVTSATANVLGTVKSGREIFEEKESVDFSTLSLHQAKRMEMEVQVKVLELESSLEKERRRLASIRKVHYQLAGPSEGWDNAPCPPK